MSVLFAAHVPAWVSYPFKAIVSMGFAPAVVDKLGHWVCVGASVHGFRTRAMNSRDLSFIGLAMSAWSILQSIATA